MNPGQQAAYEESEERELEPILAAESFIPVGLFAEPRKRLRFLKRARPPSGGETATALISGIVERTEMRRNTLTDVDFAWARVRSYGGVTFDLVTPPAQVTPTFAPGAIVQTLVWLVGSVELD